MAFTGNGMKVANAFTKGGQSTGFKQAQDKLVTVESYNLAKASVMVVDTKNHKYEVTVDKKAIDRAVEKEKARAEVGPVGSWSGYAIDQRMQAAIPVGSTMILERSLPGRQYRSGSDTITTLECGWVKHATNPDPKKTFEGLFSVATYKKKITSVQAWNNKALAVDNAEAIEKISEELNANAEAIKNKEYRPGLGVQFRVVVPSGNPKAPLSVIDTSPAFDWVPGEKDASGKVVQEGRPLDGDKFVELLSQYTNDYVEQKFTQYPDKKVEILTYTNYFAAPKSVKMVVPESEWHPYNKLAETETRLALDDQQTITGKNFAVNGILELTDDGVDKVNKTFFRRDMVKDLHANGFIGNIQSWIRGANDEICRPHDGLKVIKVRASANADGDMPAGEAETPPVAASAPMASPAAVQDPFANDDPFGDAAGFHEKPAAPAAAPEPAKAPAATTGTGTRKRTY